MSVGTLVKPPKLGAGARVALVAPSGPLLDRGDVLRAAELCEALGFIPVISPHVESRYGYLAGNDIERVTDLNDALRRRDIDAVWCVRGGYGLTRIIDAVDFQSLAMTPKCLIGFSDISALLLGAIAKAGVITFHAPTARQPMPAFSRRSFEMVLSRGEVGALETARPAPDILVPRPQRIVTISGGRAEGRLIGGNLAVMTALVGTPFMPSLRGALLVLEDVGEAVYRIDRMLSQLRLAGLLDDLAGVIIGHFTEIPGQLPDGALAIDDVMTHYFGTRNIPVARGMPIGHIEEQWTLPLGAHAAFDADAGTLTLLEAGVN